MIDNRCTLFPNGDWLPCCVAHDYAAADARHLHRSAARRREADVALFRCVARRPGWWHLPVAAVMYAGVRLWALMRGGY